MAQLEEDIVRGLCAYLGATKLYERFVEFRTDMGSMAPVYKDVQDEKVIFVTEFREGRLVKDFLREKLKDFPEKNAQETINKMIDNWQSVVAYCLMKISEERKANSSQ